VDDPSESRCLTALVFVKAIEQPSRLLADLTADNPMPKDLVWEPRVP